MPYDFKYISAEVLEANKIDLSGYDVLVSIDGLVQGTGGDTLKLRDGSNVILEARFGDSKNVHTFHLDLRKYAEPNIITGGASKWYILLWNQP